MTRRTNRKARWTSPLLIASLSLTGALLVGCGDDQAGGDGGYEADEVPAAPRGDPSTASPADPEDAAEAEPEAPPLPGESEDR